MLLMFLYFKPFDKILSYLYKYGSPPDRKPPSRSIEASKSNGRFLQEIKNIVNDDAPNSSIILQAWIETDVIDWTNFKYPGGQEILGYIIVLRAIPMSVNSRLICNSLEYNRVDNELFLFPLGKETSSYPHEIRCHIEIAPD